MAVRSSAASRLQVPSSGALKLPTSTHPLPMKRTVALLGGPMDGRFIQAPPDVDTIAIPHRGASRYMEFVYRRWDGDVFHYVCQQPLCS
jgi:hypothetical protein